MFRAKITVALSSTTSTLPAGVTPGDFELSLIKAADGSSAGGARVALSALAGGSPVAFDNLAPSTDYTVTCVRLASDGSHLGAMATVNFTTPADTTPQPTTFEIPGGLSVAIEAM